MEPDAREWAISGLSRGEAALPLAGPVGVSRDQVAIADPVLDWIGRSVLSMAGDPTRGGWAIAMPNPSHAQRESGIRHRDRIHRPHRSAKKSAGGW